MGIFILEKGTSPYWDGGQDASDCRSGLGHYAVGATTIAVHPPPEGPQGEGLPMPEPYRPSPRTHVPARLRYPKPAVQLPP